jgi:aldehyde dehydrogenase (NAD+)
VVEQAVDDLIDGLLLSTRFHRQSQSCTAGSRLFFHEDVHEELVALVVGDPPDEASDMGTVINEKQSGAISRYLDDGRAEPRDDGRARRAAPSDGPLTEGLYLVPTVFIVARNDFRLARERPSIPFWWSSRGVTAKRWSAWSTTASTGSRPTCGRTTRPGR